MLAPHRHMDNLERQVWDWMELVERGKMQRQDHDLPGEGNINARYPEKMKEAKVKLKEAFALMREAIG